MVKGAAHLKYSYLMSGFHLLVRGDQGIYTFTFWAYFAVSAADLLHWCWCGDHVNIDGRWCLLCHDTASHHWLSSPHHPLLELDTAVGALNKQAELLFPRILNTKQILWSDNEDWDWEHSLHRFYLNLLLHLLLLLHFTTRLAAVLWGDLNDLPSLFLTTFKIDTVSPLCRKCVGVCRLELKLVVMSL